jgi:hypothetical protein
MSYRVIILLLNHKSALKTIEFFELPWRQTLNFCFDCFFKLFLNCSSGRKNTYYVELMRNVYFFTHVFANFPFVEKPLYALVA